MNSRDSVWEQQGCPSCRVAWESGTKNRLLYLGRSIELHVRLYQCGVCHAFWKELERYAHVVDADEARGLRANGSFEHWSGPAA